MASTSGPHLTVQHSQRRTRKSTPDVSHGNVGNVNCKNIPKIETSILSKPLITTAIEILEMMHTPKAI